MAVASSTTPTALRRQGDTCRSAVAIRRRRLPAAAGPGHGGTGEGALRQPGQGSVTRYELPNILALNFVLTGALDARAAPCRWRSDSPGQGEYAWLLRMEIDAAAMPRDRGDGREGDVVGCLTPGR